MTMILYLALLFGAILSLVAGLFLTRLTWRADAEPFSRASPIFEVALHPARFAKPDRLRDIRLLNLIGAILLAGALAVIIYDIVTALQCLPYRRCNGQIH